MRPTFPNAAGPFGDVRRRPLLVLEDFDVGETGVVIDADMRELPASSP